MAFATTFATFESKLVHGVFTPPSGAFARTVFSAPAYGLDESGQGGLATVYFVDESIQIDGPAVSRQPMVTIA